MASKDQESDASITKLTELAEHSDGTYFLHFSFVGYICRWCPGFIILLPFRGWMFALLYVFSLVIWSIGGLSLSFSLSFGGVLVLIVLSDEVMFPLSPMDQL